jgi:Cytochrome c554 and c-prime
VVFVKLGEQYNQYLFYYAADDNIGVAGSHINLASNSAGRLSGSSSMKWIGWVAALISWTFAWTQSQPQPVLRGGTTTKTASIPSTPSYTGTPKTETAGYVGNEACAGCHAVIYQSYARTPMARASGAAKNNLIPADFLHAKSGVHYQIYSQSGTIWLSFERPGDPAVRSKRQLLYYIGSGHRGLSYLFSRDGFLFESPVNWYANEHRWDMAPGYQDIREIPLNLPAVPSCLRCHVSGMRAPIKGTENLYPMPVFVHSGITCERCHGPGEAHVHGGSIVNPAKLSPERRDEVCMQCHLEGKVAIERPGRHVYEFQPGESLSDYIRNYVVEGDRGPGLGGVSQVEALAQSICKKKSGDAMSCTSCHDSHYEPTAADRVAYYRGKCLACHGTHFGALHQPHRHDCTSCHMPASASTDVAHTQVTDHRIFRRPPLAAQTSESDKASPAALRLVPFPDSPQAEQDERDLALAWESLAASGVKAAEPQAEALLRSAVSDFPKDAEILTALGYIDRKHGLLDQARELYEQALTVDPDSIDAAGNLGVIEAETGHMGKRQSYGKGRSTAHRAEAGLD